MATVFSYAYMWAARKFTKSFIWITGILNIVFGFATAVYMLYRKYWSGGIVFLIFSVFYVFCFISWIVRITNFDACKQALTLWSASYPLQRPHAPNRH